MARSPHKKAHAVCPYGVDGTWAECDKVFDGIRADWDAMQQVILAARIVDRRDTRTYRKGKDAFSQLVRWMDGQQADIMNDDGNSHVGAFVVRLRAARERYIAGDLPRYNLYTPPGV